MAYTDPFDWSTGALVTATQLDTYLKDNMRWVGGGSSLAANEGRGTTLPVAPVDGQLFVYVADSTAGVEWLCKYNLGDGGSYKWHVIGPAALYAEVLTAQNLASTPYAALTTAGPSITLPIAGDYDVEIGYTISTPGSGGRAFMSYDIGGTAAVDADYVAVGCGSALSIDSGSRLMRKTGLTAVALVSKYKSLDTTLTFSKRWMRVTPVRIG